MKLSIYAGVGSREAPEEVLVVLEELGRILAVRGWVLRSGNARGADQAFAKALVRRCYALEANL